VAKHSKDTFLRRKALKNLSNTEFLNLDEWEYQFLAQYCDAQTAIALARNNSNPNLITCPREFKNARTECEIVANMKSLMDSMDKHPCVRHILQTTNAFEYVKDDEHEGLMELHHENDHILRSLDHLLHLTTKPDLCVKIAELNGLDSLLDIYKNFQQNADIKMILNKIITNMSSANDTIADYFFKSGWIYLLSKFQHDDDLRIQVLASTALHNLDKYDSSGFVYKPKMYPLYPRGKINEKPALDIIFIHGLLGGIWITWRVQRESDRQAAAFNKETPNEENLNSFMQEESMFTDEKIIQMEPGAASKIVTLSEQTTKTVFAALNEMAEDRLSNDDLKLTRRILKHIVRKLKDTNYSFCWPLDWLPQRFPNIRIMGLQYESALSYWNSKVCPCEKDKLQLRSRSTDYLERLADAGVGENRPVIFVSHSMGGLLVKHFVNQALASDNPKIRQIGENCRGIIFLGVPHRGSAIAKASQQTSALLWPTVEVKDLEENSKELLKLNDEFLRNILKMPEPVEIVSVAEGSSTKIFQNIKLYVVPLESAYLGIGDFYVSQENHLNLSKALSQNSFIYLTVCNMIEKILNRHAPPTT